MNKRIRREHIKLAKQNLLVTEYLLDNYDLPSKLGLVEDWASFATTKSNLEINKTLAIEHILILKSQDSMPFETANEALECNKINRSGYAEYLNEQKTLQKAGFSNRESLLPFDQKFEPDEGWEKYIEMFEANTDFL